MRRNIDGFLDSFINTNENNVLLIRGARQVGKTYAVRELGKKFEHFLEVNFEEQRAIRGFFAGDLTPGVINEKLSAYFNLPIIAGRTLVFFDEIQACPRALQALRFYHEKMPELHVVAAGSLLEFALSEIPSYGVGRIAGVFMYPMTFDEFLLALGEDGLSNQILKASPARPLDAAFHQKLLESFRTHTLIGGLPAVVKNYAEGRDLRRCQEEIDTLITALEDDFAKYKKRAPVAKLRETFRSAALQAGGKFTYAKISSPQSPYGYKEALELLVMAGLLHKVHHTAARGLPLGAQTDPKKFKVIPFDLGVHQRMLGLDLGARLVAEASELINKGALAEVFAGLELIKAQSPRTRPQLFYWHREARGANAEIDYVIQKDAEIIPIEVKSGTKGRMQSLFLFMEERGLSRGVRLSQENFGLYDKIATVPVYAARRIIGPD